MAWTDVPDFTVGQWTSNGTWSVTNDATTAQPPPVTETCPRDNGCALGKFT